VHNSTRYYKVTYSSPKVQHKGKRILGFTYPGKRTNVPFTWGKLCIRAQYPSKAEAVGITSYMVQLKEGITLTAQKNRDIGGVLK